MFYTNSHSEANIPVVWAFPYESESFLLLLDSALNPEKDNCAKCMQGRRLKYGPEYIVKATEQTAVLKMC